MRRLPFADLALSEETIQFQNPRFFKELSLHFDILKAVPAKNREHHKASTELLATVKEHTGFKLDLHYGQFGPMIEIPTLDHNHPFFTIDHKRAIGRSDGITLINHADSVIKGSVNLHTGKVTGIFTEHVYQSMFPHEMLDGAKYTPGECAAALLHELGHLVTYCEYISRTVSTNQILAGMARALGDTQNLKERETVLRRVKDVMHLKELDEKELAWVKDDKALETVVLTHIVRQTRAEIGSNIYDYTAWEALSDQYAARMGAGADLVTALYKLEGGFKLGYRSTGSYYALEALKVSLFAASWFFLPLLLVPTVMVIADSQDLTYDQPNMRFTRIRNQLIEALKSPQLSDVQKSAYLADIEAVDQVLLEVKDREQFFGWLYNLINSSYRKRVQDAQLARELESYASNPLFVEALKLQHLATSFGKTNTADL